MIGIYKITNPNKRIYIGQSINIHQRFITYKSINKSKRLTKLYRSFLKYGIESHEFEIVEVCKMEELNERERFYQEKYNTLNHGLNCFLTDTSDKRRVRSKETLFNMSVSQKMAYKEGRHIGWLGKTHSEKTKLKISRANSGRKYSKEINLKKGRKGRISNRKGVLGTGKPVLQYSLNGQFIKEWKCRSDIKRELDLYTGNISSCCNGKLKTAYGFIWKHK